MMKLAIAGTGMIVAGALEALKQVPEIEVTAICAGPHHPEKAARLAGEHHIPHAYQDYHRMLAEESDADFVYIGVVNSAHYEYGMAALEAGKHVIMEKPFTATCEEAVSLCRKARERGLYVFEAVTFLYAPFFQRIREMAGRLGRIRMVQCNYSKYSSRYDRYLKGDIAPVFDPQQAGGSLLDLNIYNLHFVSSLLGKPADARYVSNKGYNGIDLSGTVVMTYPDMVATCTAAKDSYSPCFDIVQGERGYMMIHGSPDNLAMLELVVDGKREEENIAPSHHRMVDEFKAFARIYEARDERTMLEYMDHTLMVMEIVGKSLGN